MSATINPHPYVVLDVQAPEGVRNRLVARLKRLKGVTVQALGEYRECPAWYLYHVTGKTEAQLEAYLDKVKVGDFHYCTAQRSALEDIKERAHTLSLRNESVKHVLVDNCGEFYISDWYDPTRVTSYENGRELPC